MTSVKNISWRFWAEIVALLSVVASLMFVAYELRMSRDIAMSEESARASDRALEVYQLIGSNSEIWTRGCAGEDLTNEEATAFLNIVAALDARKFFNWAAFLSGLSPGGSNGPRDIARNLYYFSGFESTWRELKSINEVTYSEGFDSWITAVEEQLSELQTLAPEKNLSISLCGQ